MNIDDLEDYLDWRRSTKRVTAQRTTLNGKPVAMSRMTRKPLDREAQDHIERSNDDDG